MNFCVAILLKIKENAQHFQHIMLNYLKKSKNTTEMQKICAVYGGAGNDRMCQKWFVTLHAGDFSLDDAPWSGWPAELDSDQIKTLTENNHRYTMWGDSWHARNTQINEVLGENEKCVFCFMRKTKWAFWPTQYNEN